MEAKVNRLFDAHFHPRQESIMMTIIRMVAKYCYAGVAMGNTNPPYSAENVRENKKQIISAARGKGFGNFDPIMTIMMKVGLTKADLKKAWDEGARVLKLIPGDTSHNSTGMVPLLDLYRYYDLLEYAGQLGFIFSIHLELAREQSGEEIDELHQEGKAIPLLELLIWGMEMRKHRPAIVVEHVSTKELLDFVLSAPDWVFATITTQHLFGNYSMLYDQDMKIVHPKNYCKPVLKTPYDQLALQRAVLSGSLKLFFGSDFAWHPRETKDLKVLKGKKPNAGVYCPYDVAIPLLWEMFLSHFEGNIKKTKIAFNNFTSGFGAAVYGLYQEPGQLRLKPETWTTAKTVHDTPIFWGEKKLNWKVEIFD